MRRCEADSWNWYFIIPSLLWMRTNQLNQSYPWNSRMNIDFPFSLCSDEIFHNNFFVSNHLLCFNLQRFWFLFYYDSYYILWCKYISIKYMVTIRTIVKSFIEIACSWWTKAQTYTPRKENYAWVAFIKDLIIDITWENKIIVFYVITRNAVVSSLWNGFDLH